MRSSPIAAAAFRPFFDVAGLELHFALRGAARLRGVMTPDAGEAVGLQLEPRPTARSADRDAPAGARRTCASMPSRCLHVVPKLVGQHVGLRKIARRAEPLLQLAEESQVEVDVRSAGQ